MVLARKIRNRYLRTDTSSSKEDKEQILRYLVPTDNIILKEQMLSSSKEGNFLKEQILSSSKENFRILKEHMELPAKNRSKNTFFKEHLLCLLSHTLRFLATIHTKIISI